MQQITKINNKPKNIMQIVKGPLHETIKTIDSLSEEDIRRLYVLIRSRNEATFGILLHDKDNGFVFRYKEAKGLGYHGYYPTAKAAIEASLNRTQIVIVAHEDLQTAIAEITR